MVKRGLKLIWKILKPLKAWFCSCFQVPWLISSSSISVKYVSMSLGVATDGGQQKVNKRTMGKRILVKFRKFTIVMRHRVNIFVTFVQSSQGTLFYIFFDLWRELIFLTLGGMRRQMMASWDPGRPHTDLTQEEGVVTWTSDPTTTYYKCTHPPLRPINLYLCLLHHTIHTSI